MGAMTRQAETAQEQAIHDQSVIDHLIHTFHAPGVKRETSPGDVERSSAIYHQIRRTWDDDTLTRWRAHLR
jgi:hypothetical protein